MIEKSIVDNQIVEIVLNKDKHIYELKGDFKFEVSPTIFHYLTFKPFRRCTFEFCVETEQDLKALNNQTDDEVLEIISEKLKQDFIKFMKNEREKNRNEAIKI